MNRGFEGFLIDELLTASPKRYSDQCHDNSLTIFPVDGHSWKQHKNAYLVSSTCKNYSAF